MVLFDTSVYVFVYLSSPVRKPFCRPWLHPISISLYLSRQLWSSLPQSMWAESSGCIWFVANILFELCLVSVCKITPIIIVIVSKTLHFMQTKTSTFDIIFVCRLDTEYMHICTVHAKWNSRTNGFLNGWWHIKQHSNHAPCNNRQWGRLANVATNIIYILYTC